MKIYDDPDEEKKIWEVREAGLGATARVPDEPVTWEGWEDSAVPPERSANICARCENYLKNIIIIVRFTDISATAAFTRASNSA